MFETSSAGETRAPSSLRRQCIRNASGCGAGRCGGGTAETPPPAAAAGQEPGGPCDRGTHRRQGDVHRDGAGASADQDRRPTRTARHPSRPRTSSSGSDGALQNVFVYVKDGLGNLVFPVPTTPVVLEQERCRYKPHVLGIQVGQTLDIVNGDDTLHNIHAVPTNNGEFNKAQQFKGFRNTHVFNTKEVMVPFKCDVHRWMTAYVGVLDHPFFAVTGNDGTFTLEGLPPGTYTIEAVHEKLRRQTQSVTLEAKGSQDITFTFKT